MTRRIRSVRITVPPTHRQPLDRADRNGPDERPCEIEEEVTTTLEGRVHRDIVLQRRVVNRSDPEPISKKVRRVAPLNGQAVRGRDLLDRLHLA